MSIETPTPRVFAITGGSSGLGRAAVEWVLDQGDIAVNLDLAQHSEAEAPNEHFIRCDVRSTTDVNQAFDEIREKFGRLDGLTNCAGVAKPDPSELLSDESWDRLIDIHLSGTMRCCRAGFAMLKASGGSIVNVSSVAATLAVPRRLSYNSAKAGVGGITRTLAVEWAEAGIRVNSVAPGYIATAMTEALFASGQLDTRPIIARTPMGRLGAPKEVATVIGFLHSDGASYVTGSTIPIDGGIGVNAF